VIAKVTGGGNFRSVLDYLTQPKKQSHERAKPDEREHELELERARPEHEIVAPGKNKSAVAREHLGATSETEKALDARDRVEDERAVKDEERERHRLIGGNMAGRTARELAREFEVFREQRPEIAKPVHHVSLSAALGERLTVEEWNEIAEKYVRRTGFEHSPYVVIRHVDTEHDHVHIVTSRVDAHAKVVSDFRSKARAEEFVREIEEEYDLVRVRRSRDIERAAPKRGELERFERTGELSAKMKLQGHVDYALKEKATATEFVERLSRVGVEVIPYFRSADLVTGVSFRLGGQLMKGSDLGRGYSWPGLQKRGLEYDRQRDLAGLREALTRAAGERQNFRIQPARATGQVSESANRGHEIGRLDRLTGEPDAESRARELLRKLALVESGRDGRGAVERLNEIAGVVQPERPAGRGERAAGRGLIREPEPARTPGRDQIPAPKEKTPEKVFDLIR
jgi:hypothetical protein